MTGRDDRTAALVRALRLLFVINLTISGNFLAGLFGCQMQRLMGGNAYARHAVGLCTLLFFVVLVADDAPTPGGRLPLALGVYALFTLSNRMHHAQWAVFISLLLLLYIAHVAAGDAEAPAARDALRDAQVGFGVAALAVVAAGVPLYLVDKRREYGVDFSLVKFLVGTPVCHNNGNGAGGPPR